MTNHPHPRVELTKTASLKPNPRNARTHTDKQISQIATRAALEQLKADMGSAAFEAQYQQQPVPLEGNLVRGEWLASYTPGQLHTLGGQIVQSWDTASKEGLHNDWSVCITACVVRGKVYMLDVLRKRLIFPDLKKAAISLARDQNASTILVEDQASGTQLVQTLQAEKDSGAPRAIARKPEGDKISRLAGVSSMIEAGQLLLPPEAPWLAEFTRELLASPNSRHDDQVDALSQMLAWVRTGIARWQGPPDGGKVISLDDVSDEEYYNSDPLSKMTTILSKAFGDGYR